MVLLDAGSRAQIASGAAALGLSERDSETAVMSAGTPEEAIAYDEGWVRQRLGKHGLAVGGLWPGTWSGRLQGSSFQDIVLSA